MLKMNACDLCMLEELVFDIRSYTEEEDHTFLSIRPAMDEDKKLLCDVCQRARALALVVCNFMAGNSQMPFRGGVFRISDEGDIDRTREHLRCTEENALLWIDFGQPRAGRSSELQRQNIQAFVDDAGRNKAIVVLMTSDSTNLECLVNVEHKTDCIDYLLEKAPLHSIPVNYLSGMIRILPMLSNDCHLDWLLGCHDPLLSHACQTYCLLDIPEISGSVLRENIEHHFALGNHDVSGIYRDDDNSVRICVSVRDIQSLTKLRDQLLVDDHESVVALTASLGRLSRDAVSLRFDRTAIAHMYEEMVLCLEHLTEHQHDALFKSRKESRIRIEAPAGAGKSFIALNDTLEHLERRAGKVLYICRNTSLAFHFVRWLCCRFPTAAAASKKVLRGIFFLTFDDPRVSSIFCIKSNRKGILECSDDPVYKSLRFTKIVIDEAHDVLSNADAMGKMFCNKVNKILSEQSGYELMLLSDESQASVDPEEIQWPENVALVELTDVCRSSKRVVAGARAFQLGDGKEIGCSHKSNGIPLRPFLFDGEGDEADQYATEVLNALEKLLREFPGLDLHDRLAIILPNEEFRESFCTAFQKN